MTFERQKPAPANFFLLQFEGFTQLTLVEGFRPADLLGLLCVFFF